MTHPSKQTPREILATMLGSLGFPHEIEEIPAEGGLTLQIRTSAREALTGPGGQRIADLQYLLNRLLQTQDPASPKVTVDVEGYRARHDESLIEHVQRVAEAVRQSGRPFHLEPMSAYDRRLIHNAFKNDPRIRTTSPEGDAPFKRITLEKKG